MKRIWNSPTGPLWIGLLIGVAIVFAAAPVGWALVRWWSLFFPAAFAL